MPVLDNSRHERFAHEVAKGATSRDAYKAAGYETSNIAAADASASRLLSNAKIQARVAELRETISERTIEKTAVSKAWVIAKLVENVERAMTAEPVLDNEGNPTGEYKYNGAVANRALELIGKEQGMFIDRKEVGQPGDFERMDDNELAEFIAQNTQDLLQMDPDFAKRVADQRRTKGATKH